MSIEVNLTFDEALQHAQHWAAAWNAHDLDRILSFYADDVVFEVSTAVTRWQKPDGKLRGKSELRKHFGLGLQIAPQLRFEIETVFLAPSGYAVLYRRDNGNRVVDCVTLDSDGLASHAIAYYAGAQQ